MQAPVGCVCESIRPGKTILPPRSTTRVFAPRDLRTSSSVPTAIRRPSLTARAWRIEKSRSTVTTLPWCTIRSASSARAGGDARPRARSTKQGHAARRSVINGAPSMVRDGDRSRRLGLPVRLLRGLAPGRGAAGGALLAVFLVTPGPDRGELLDPVGLFRGAVELLGAVGREVVQLPRRTLSRGDDLPVADPEGPVALVLEEDRVALDPYVVRQRGHQAAPGQGRPCFAIPARGSGGAGEVQERGHD